MLRYNRFIAVAGLVGSIAFIQAATENADFKSPGEWMFAEVRAENAVVQVSMQGTGFNWIDPYKSPEQREGFGSGFFIDTEGHLLTNYHVVAGAKSVFIMIPGVGRRLLAVSIVGVCPDLDVALLKLTPESYKSVIDTCGPINALEFSDSDKLYSSQDVLALGFPLGFHTRKSTTGSIGGRDFLHGQSLVHITAPINPGSSGGPLLNKEGKVVGITSASIVDAQNYNYIVPINDILIILKDLYKTPLVRLPGLSVGANRTTEAHARSLKNPLPAGAYVNNVLNHSMEEKAGIKVGDMIYKIIIDGAHYQLDEFGDVAVPWRKGEKISVEELLSRCRIGDPFAVIVYRAGERRELSCIFEQSVLPTVREIYVEYEPNEADYEIFGGIVVMQLRDNHVRLFEKAPQLDNLREFRDCARPVNRSKPALVITRIMPGSQAHLTECLMTGFILDKVNGRKVSTLKELREALILSTKNNAIALHVKDQYATVLDLSKVLRDEERLSRDFVFPITDTVKKLMATSKKRRA